jgi:hypothetical protein
VRPVVLLDQLLKLARDIGLKVEVPALPIWPGKNCPPQRLSLWVLPVHPQMEP